MVDGVEAADRSRSIRTVTCLSSAAVKIPLGTSSNCGVSLSVCRLELAEVVFAGCDMWYNVLISVVLHDRSFSYTI